MSPAESEGLNKKSLVLPETKISLKLIRSSGIVKRGILEALLAPVELQAALLKGLKYKFFEVKNNEIPMTSRLKNPPTIFVYQGIFEASRQRGPRLSRSCRSRRPPSFFFVHKSLHIHFHEKNSFGASSKKTAHFFYENQIPKIFSCRLF